MEEQNIPEFHGPVEAWPNVACANCAVRAIKVVDIIQPRVLCPICKTVGNLVWDVTRMVGVFQGEMEFRQDAQTLIIPLLDRKTGQILNAEIDELHIYPDDGVNYDLFLAEWMLTYEEFPYSRGKKIKIFVHPTADLNTNTLNMLLDISSDRIIHPLPQAGE